MKLRQDKIKKLTKYGICDILKHGTVHNGRRFSPEGEVITMTTSELFQFVIMLTGVISLVYKVIKDFYDKK